MLAERIIPEAVVDRIRTEALRTEAEGTPSQELLTFIYEERLFKLFVPDELEGRMTPLPEAARLFERAAWADGTFGWLLAIGAGGGFFAATLPETEARRLYTDRKALVAGSGHPSGRAIRTPGGYVVSGRWKYCSGSTFATFFTANCVVEGDGGEGDEPEIRSFAFLPEEVAIDRDWRAFGLRATESHSIVVRDVFVPEARTFDIRTEPRYGYPVYRYPFLAFAQVSFAPVVIGIGRRFLAEARALVLPREAEWTASGSGRFERAIAAIATGEERLAAAVEGFYRTIDATWTAFLREGALTEEEARLVSLASCEAARTAVDSAHLAFPHLGMSVLMEDRPANKAWRDLHTAAQHSVLGQG
ncbi:acyl-CoA dehydrogenase [Cohnella sp. REN36]|uniref:acyl-CoA dehydrogenase n=1 Tax=Cohnella sp. REN36 TaxID=2887347 RepID=UPI001D15879D|nr:acyl-CoA dehydrogenase [Cohnella sp. REN36]MCC3376848.1 acyl-CoA dehydrogenase [Cohnella sp. REN36]